MTVPPGSAPQAPLRTVPPGSAPQAPLRTAHPLAQLITDAAAGVFPEVDGGWRHVPPWRKGLWAAVAFTGHAVFALDDVDDARLTRLGADGFGGAHDPRVIAELAGPGTWIGCLDLLTVAAGTGAGGSDLVPRLDLAYHPRVEPARALRSDLHVWGYPDSESVAIVATGIAGLTEISFELDPVQRGRGNGSKLIADVLGLVPAGEPVLACVSPGNAASLRALLRAGFVPVGSVQLFGPAGADYGGR